MTAKGLVSCFVGIVFCFSIAPLFGYRAVSSKPIKMPTHTVTSSKTLKKGEVAPAPKAPAKKETGVAPSTRGQKKEAKWVKKGDIKETTKTKKKKK